MSGTETAERPARKKAVVRLVPEEVLVDAAQPVRRAVSPALEVGGVHDAAEHEADRLADRVIARLRALEEGVEATDGGVPGHAGHAHHGHEPGVAHRSPAPAPEVPVTVGREGGSAGPELTSAIESMRGGGRALDAGVRRGMGEAFGRDLSGVRVHTDGRAAAAAAQMGAVAFTTGRDIFFGAGQYRLDTDAGRHVLAHELAHTVQQEGSTRRTVSRLWDLSSPSSVDLSRTARISILEDREVMFLKDDSGDSVVVKLEPQPIGIGELAGHMHKKLNGSETLTYVKLPQRTKATIWGIVNVDSLLDMPSWKARGEANKSLYPNIADPIERARTAFYEMLERDKGHEVLAMSIAEGRSAKKVAEKDVATGNGEMRAVLERPGHMRELGRMTAIDLFLGNRDRVEAGNLGNWFYSDTGVMTVIDNVDSSNDDKTKQTMAAGLLKGRTDVESAALAMMAKSQLRTTAEVNLKGLQRVMRALDRDTNGRTSTSVDDWFTAKVGSRTRFEVLTEEFLSGLVEGRKKLIKVFGTTRWTVGGKKKDRDMKKAIKADAAAAGTLDGAGGVYYETLKARGAWLAKH